MTAPAPALTEEAVFTGLRAWLGQLLPIDPSNIQQGLVDEVSGPGAAPQTPAIVMTTVQLAKLARAQTTYAWDGTNGSETRTQPQDFQIQLDIYGMASLDYASAIKVLWEEEPGIDLARQLIPGCSPLWAEAPRLAPVVTGEQAAERRRVMTLHLQVPQAFTLPQSFPASLVSAIIPVEAVYPA